MHEFKHPKYYKELRKRNKLDQAISLEDSTESVCGVRPDPGPKLQAETHDLAEATGLKQQATSNKRQAPSSEKNKPQAPSPKRQASS